MLSSSSYFGLGLLGLSIGSNHVLRKASRPGSTLMSSLGFAKPNPPKAKKVPRNVYFGLTPEKPDEYRGTNPMDPPIKHSDPYFWLRDDERKDTSDPEAVELYLTYLQENFKPVVYRSASVEVFDEEDAQVVHPRPSYWGCQGT